MFAQYATDNVQFPPETATYIVGIKVTELVNTRASYTAVSYVHGNISQPYIHPVLLHT